MPKASQALRKPEAVRIVPKDVPIINEKNRKLVQYSLRDSMFRFWFRFVTKGTSVIERNYGETYFHNVVEPYLHEYMGSVFAMICQDYTFARGISGAYGQILTRVGKWRDNDSQKRCPADIDVVAVDDVKKTVVIGECKFKNTAFGKEEYETLMDRARLVMPYKVTNYLIFSLSGVTKWVEDTNDPRVEIVSMDQLYQINIHTM